jgi:UPF0271 protein
MNFGVLMKTIDLNCDMGELPELVSDGTQESLMESLSSVNIACGGHAGDENTMRATIEQALRKKVAVGAHPGYVDRKNFGRLELELTAQEIAESVYEQLTALDRIAQRCGAHIGHVKPHGALYNQAAGNREIARAIAKGVARWRRDVVLMGLAESTMLEEFRDARFTTAAEAFADRRYEANGTLRSRKFADALIEDPADAARQAVSIAKRGVVRSWDAVDVKIQAQTICIHGDTPGAVRMAAAVAKSLLESGVQLRSLGRRE